MSFPANEVMSSNDIYMEVVGENNRINLEEHIRANCDGYGNFFTSHTGSNSNTNNMDNLVMINTVIPPEKLKFLKVPDRYDLIQLIALNKGIQQGEKIDYFTFDSVQDNTLTLQEIGQGTTRNFTANPTIAIQVFQTLENSIREQEELEQCKIQGEN